MAVISCSCKVRQPCASSKCSFKAASLSCSTYSSCWGSEGVLTLTIIIPINSHIFLWSLIVFSKFYSWTEAVNRTRIWISTCFESSYLIINAICNRTMPIKHFYEIHHPLQHQCTHQHSDSKIWQRWISDFMIKVYSTVNQIIEVNSDLFLPRSP